MVLLADDAGEELAAEHRRLRRARVAERLREDDGGGVGERLEAVCALEQPDEAPLLDVGAAGDLDDAGQEVGHRQRRAIAGGALLEQP